MSGNVAPQVVQVRNRLRETGMSDWWKRAADEDAAQLIGLIGADGYAAWIAKDSGVTDKSTWRDISLAICEKIYRVLIAQDAAQINALERARIRQEARLQEAG